MNNLSDDILDFVKSYAAERGREDDKTYIVGLMAFAGRLLSQKLQQTPCSTLRELLVQKMNSVTEERKELSYNSITDIEKAQEIETINWVLSLIDASQPVA